MVIFKRSSSKRVDRMLRLDSYCILRGVILSVSAICSTACIEQQGQMVVFLHHGLDVDKDVHEEPSLETSIKRISDGYIDPDDTPKRDLPSSVWTVVIDATEEPTELFQVDAALLLNLDPKIRLAQRTTEIDVPEDEVRAMNLPLSFLCAESPEDPPGHTDLVLDQCVYSDPRTHDYNKTIAFAPMIGGKYFDGPACFDAAPVKLPEWRGSACVVSSGVPEGSDVNVALVTRNIGFCGRRGCYIPLNADDALEAPGGFHGGDIELSEIICRRIPGVVSATNPANPEASPDPALQIEGLVISEVTAGCPQKVITLPVGVSPLNEAKVTTLVGAIQNPVSIALSRDRVLWTEGVFGVNGERGAVMAIQKAGGSPEVVASGQHAPRAIHVNPDADTALWANAGTETDNGQIVRATRTGDGWDVKPMASGLVRPNSIATLDFESVFWTELSGKVKHCRAFPCTQSNTAVLDTNTAPLEIVVDASHCCWSLAKPMDSSSVDCARWSPEGGISSSLEPTSLVLGELSTMAVLRDDQERAIAAYFAVPERKLIMGGDLPGSELDLSGIDPTNLDNLDSHISEASYGIALDTEHVYWTSRSSGTVLRCRLNECKQGALEVVASGQLNPMAIAVDKDSDDDGYPDWVCWINQGTPGGRDGSVNCLAKSDIPRALSPSR